MSENISGGDILRFRCLNPKCRAVLKAKPDQVGRRFRCPKCKMPVTVPEFGQTRGGTSEILSAAETDALAPSPPEPNGGMRGESREPRPREKMDELERETESQAEEERESER